MDSAVDIIEVLSDGKYKLNEHELQTIVSKAKDCDDFALISIIGPKYSGKSLFMNSLVKYLESENKNIWPKDCVIEWRTGFKNPYPKRSAVIQLWSKPFILEAKGQKTAVFLMDSCYVIDGYNSVMSTKTVEDLIGLFFATSSTVIYKHSNQISDISTINELLSKVQQFIGTKDSFQELFYVIYDWNQKSMDSGEEYTFGLNGGQRYLRDQPKFNELNIYFNSIECYLMPTAGPALHNMDFKFNEFNDDFLLYFSQLIKYSLLNGSELQVKSHPVSGRSLMPPELMPLFRSYVNKLNGDSLPIDFGLNLSE